MNTVEYIAFTIDRLPKGYVFTYADFITNVNSKEAIDAGKIKPKDVESESKKFSLYVPYWA